MPKQFVRSSLLLCVLALAAQAAFACKPGIEHRKLSQADVQNIQKNKVNTGKEMWRLEAPQVAAREAPALDAGYKGAPEKAPVKFVKGDDRTQVFQYKASDGRTLELTLKKPEWLLPYAGIYKMEMWVVTDVKTTCGK
ncbi:MAG: hypothetical protein P4M01_08890 [Acidobacteriota bacterium]|nr:hypothetical protein [Acidobacteriota bacterium]